MLDALLVQLFGREVTDRLAQAGYDSTEAIARVNAEMLADEAGIAPALARRIIAVAVESGHVVPDEESEAATDPSPSSPPGDTPSEIGALPAPEVEPQQEAGQSDRHVRRPFRRPQSTLAAPPEAPEGEERGETAAGTEETLLRPRGAPFVDDAGLIFSIGSAVRSGRPEGMTIAVAEEILDAPSRKSRSPETQRSSEIPTAASGPGEKPALLENSFWSFGIWRPATSSPAHAGPSRRTAASRRAPARKGGQHGREAKLPRRRSGDGH